MGKRLRSAMALVFCVPLLAIACGGETPEPSPTPISSPTITPISLANFSPLTPTVEATVPPTAISLPVPGSIGVPQEGGELGAIYELADLRYAFHDDRLRVVWEMEGTGDVVPHYRVVEVDNATEPFPSGADPSWGAARIDLVVSDLYARDYPLGTELPMTFEANPVTTRLGLYPTYDDALLGFSIGLEAPTEYEVYELTSPVRLVIDVLY